MELIFSPLAVAVLVILAVISLTMALRPARSARVVGDRLDNYLAEDRQEARQKAATADALREPFVQRVLIPSGRQLLQVLGRLMPTGMIEDINSQLVIAGRPGNLSGLDFLGVQVLAAALGLLFAYFYGGMLLTNPLYKLLAPFVGAAFGYMLPKNWLSGKMRTRKDTILRALPDALDMLTICVEAGLAFESAMQRVSDQWKGPLSQEFGHVVTEIRLGVPRSQALRRMSLRCDVPDVSSFVAVLVQADAMGTSIAQVLHSQAEQMRVLRRQRAEEKANKAPIKVIMAMLVFIFPALFIVILGPAVPKILAAFGGM
ncbi:MAG: type II secretion system F family protein [Chloroflexi bacterium]|nr:type II secretion system F family protein [Chloroflexota bacterium]